MTAAKISYLSPSTISKSGFNVSNASPNPMTPIKVDFPIPIGVSFDRCKSIL